MATQPVSSLWWRDGVVYQIYPRSFADSNGDGVGDLPGIMSKLDYLQWLGVDAIWLSPIYPSPMADFGYDVSNYHDIDPVFGSLADFDRLISEAHARGIRVVLDMVMNHTSDQHPWFVDSRSSRDNPKRDWYIWRDPKNGREPNNWEAVFGGKAWQFDERTGQYYLHLFVPEQPDLNWRNPQVKAALFGRMRASGSIAASTASGSTWRTCLSRRSTCPTIRANSAGAATIDRIIRITSTCLRRTRSGRSSASY